MMTNRTLQALFAALHADVFDICAQASKDGRSGATADEIDAASSASGDRLRTLLTACVSLGLLTRDLPSGRYRCVHACCSCG